MILLRLTGPEIGEGMGAVNDGTPAGINVVRALTHACREHSLTPPTESTISTNASNRRRAK